MKVKFFNKRQHLYSELEHNINNWLAENPDVEIKDIRVVSAPVTKLDLDSNIIVCIIYQEVPGNESE